MISNSEIKNQILEKLKMLPVWKQSSNGRNITIRCPYCGDSKHADHGHFSILLDTTSDAPMLYRCFRCNESGILTPQVLEDLNIGYDISLSRNLELTNKLSSSSSYFKDKIKNFYVPMQKENVLSLKKLQYLNNRLGSNISIEECCKYKIILSFWEFIYVNKIPVDTPDSTGFILKSSIINAIENSYIGFLSANNNKIVFRDISEDNSGYLGRYYKVTLDVLNRSPNTFYSLISKFYLLYNKPINIYLAEGTFDILGVYLNLSPERSENTLFFASCGYSFSTILKYLIYMGVNTDITLHIYSDKDKSDNDHKRLLSNPDRKSVV